MSQHQSYSFLFSQPPPLSISPPPPPSFLSLPPLRETCPLHYPLIITYHTGFPWSHYSLLAWATHICWQLLSVVDHVTQLWSTPGCAIIMALYKPAEAIGDPVTPDSQGFYHASQSLHYDIYNDVRGILEVWLPKFKVLIFPDWSCLPQFYLLPPGCLVHCWYLFNEIHSLFTHPVPSEVALLKIKSVPS